MKLIIKSVVLLLIVTACNSGIGTTEIETKSVDKVLSFYGGVCMRHKGFKTDNGKTETYFELEMSESELLESYSEMLDMPASNIACLFYSNLGEEQDNYTHVKVKINLSNGKSEEFYYSATELKEAEKLVKEIKIISDKIIAADYDGILAEFDTEIAKDFTTEQIESYLSQYDSAYGECKKIQFQGFHFFEEKGMSLAELMGIMIRNGQNTPLAILLNRKTKKLVGIKYEF